jgi:Na+-translocating ferredoxin:NAD+ oxidoreductase RnfD subunit
MSAPTTAGIGKPTLRIRGTSYPVLLPSLRDPRLHLAAVIISLQVLGQVAFEFRLSIAQILISLLTCAVLEIGIAMWRQKVILWPASALLTGNGVAFILRVPGTEHGDWWSVRGWWIFAGAAAVSLLSKHLIQLRGRHIFNPSNFGLVLCFLLLGSERADPLEFWWGPLSAWMVLALAIILFGGFAILGRLHLLEIAVGFWITFAVGLGVLAASGHSMTARWHVGPVSDWYFWRILAFSPEILVFLFFMITDPKTIPAGRVGRRVYAVAIGLLAALLIAPQTTEFGSKVAVLSALALVCTARPLLLALRNRVRRGALSHRALGATAAAGAIGFAALLVVAGIPARSDAGVALPTSWGAGWLPSVSVAPSPGIAPIGRGTAQQIARDLVADLENESEALLRSDRERATAGADGVRLAGLWQQIDAAGGSAVDAPRYVVERVRVSLEPGDGQAPPTVVARATGTVQRGGAPTRFVRSFELVLKDGRYLITAARGRAEPSAGPAARSNTFGGVRLQDVAARVGLDFEQSAFRFGVTNEPEAMMGGGLCWLDYDGDGWLDLFVVNAYADDEYVRWTESGGLPRSALFHNVRGRFEDVSRGSGADLQLRGNGCVAADFNQDGHTDLYVTTAGYNPATDGYDALLWGDGDGTFTEGAREAGINNPGWHAGAAVGDVNGDGLPDLFVAGYADTNAPIPSSTAGFPADHAGVRDRLYLNRGPDGDGHSRFREVGRLAGLEATHVDHGLGAVFTDVNEDGRLDLYVANDLDPNRLYVNVARPGSLGFRFVERARSVGIDDPNAGMGIAAADYNRDGREDLFVTNSRRQLHAVYRSSIAGAGKPVFADARPDFVAALGKDYAGWGVSWADLDLDGNLDLVLTNGAIPVVNLVKDAQRIQVLENLTGEGHPGEFADAASLVGLSASRRVNGRGLAAADYDNDGDVDVAINSIAGRLILLRNSGATGHWLEVKLSRFAPGTTVTAVLPDGKRLVREAHAGSSYLSSEDPRIHFGLGAATRVRELTARFPDGSVSRVTNVAADRLVVTP